MRASIAGITTAVLVLAPTAAFGADIARWEMNESAGASVMQDSSGNYIDGRIVQPNDDITIGGGVYTWDRKGPNQLPVEPERIITVPDDDRLDVTDPAVTYTLEFRYKTTENFGNIIQKGQSTAAGGQIKVQQPQGRPSCLFKGALNRVTARTPTPINDGQFHTVRCVREQNRVRIYVDGVLKQTKNGATGVINNKVAYTIGGKSNCDQVATTCDYFTGTIDYVTVSKG